MIYRFHVASYDRRFGRGFDLGQNQVIIRMVLNDFRFRKKTVILNINAVRFFSGIECFVH